jgi:RNA polymerase sigma-70 factor (ECF subfamily)
MESPRPALELSERLESKDDLSRCFDAYRKRLRAMVAFRLGDRLGSRVDASDVLQEAFLDATARLDQYRDHPTLPPFLWLRFLTAQRLDEHFRRHLGAAMRSVQNEIPLDFGFGGDSSNLLANWLVSDHTPPPDHSSRMELKYLVAVALSEMDEIDRSVIILRHFEQLTNTETALELGISEAASGKRYVRALIKIKGILSRFPGLWRELGQ